MGEHVGDDAFRIVEISVQRAGGDEACFTRHPRDHQAQLDDFFKRHGHDYRRFNYLGEWHSHPSFPAVPSGKDLHTMSSIIADPDVGANFLVLLIAKAARRRLEISATVFRVGHDALSAQVQLDEAEEEKAEGFFARICRFFSP
jgi:hypothetical protein